MVEYSTTEQKIGTWIDGDDLYMIVKVINPSTDLPTVGINNMNNYAHGIADIKKPLFCRVLSFKADSTDGDYTKMVLQESTSRAYINDVSFLVNSFRPTVIRFRRATNATDETDTLYAVCYYTKNTSS